MNTLILLQEALDRLNDEPSIDNVIRVITLSNILVMELNNNNNKEAV
jgi:hypothetical protein